MSFSRVPKTLQVTIANGAALSGAIQFQGFAFGNLMVQSAWTAASIAFQISFDGINFYPLHDELDTLIEISISAHELVYPLPTELAGAAWFKIWSETSGSGVNQGAARTIDVSLKG